MNPVRTQKLPVLSSVQVCVPSSNRLNFRGTTQFEITPEPLCEAADKFFDELRRKTCLALLRTNQESTNLLLNVLKYSVQCTCIDCISHLGWLVLLCIQFMRTDIDSNAGPATKGLALSACAGEGILLDVTASSWQVGLFKLQLAQICPGT